MKVLEAVEISLGWKDLDSRVVHPRPKIKRTKGVPHVGAILKHVAVTTGMIKTHEGSDVDPDEYPIVMALGVMVEEGIVGLYDMHWQPGELMRDGVAGNPDGHSAMTDFIPNFKKNIPILPKMMNRIVTEECKFTFYSCREKGIQDRWMWINQVASYQCLLPEDQRSGLARIHAIHICGDYSRPFVPKYLRYLVQFSKEELDATWRMILAHKDKVKPED